MQNIALSPEQILSIRSHGESAYPEECCGLLLGTITDDIKTLVEVWPEDMLRAMKHGRDRTLDIIGIYHSHPDCPAVPSECDRKMAWAKYSYIIVSVRQGSSEDLRSWSLDAEGNFQAEEIIAIEPTQIKK
ncbi:MAG: M67 family peptidase [Oscillatoriales cyanobacterium]|nr:MAG: M67 family peptidase [Oscillatoriales cyanobacterium]